MDNNSKIDTKDNNKKVIIVIMIIIIVIAVFIFTLVKHILPQMKYNKAMRLYDQGNYLIAFTILDELGKDDEIKTLKYERAVSWIEEGKYIDAYDFLYGLDYKDSNDLLEKILPLYKKELIKRSQVGDTVSFGTFEQDGDFDNGKEELKWIVLDKHDDKVLLISKYILDHRMYDGTILGALGDEGFGEIKSANWEKCDLRKWLNNDFLNDAFNSDEQKVIQESSISADSNPEYKEVDPGNDTKDKVFILSLTEVNKYFTSAESRKCDDTEYAKTQRRWLTEWWLRTPGQKPNMEMLIDIDGEIISDGFKCTQSIGVRPAIMLDLSLVTDK